MTSAIFTRAARQWARMRSDYDDHIKTMYDKALEQTGGVLVNKEGRRKGIDGLDLFYGQAAYAHKYASEELLDHWERVGRPTLSQFEQSWLLIQTLGELDG